MLEQACRRLREWTDAGLEPVPISVNQSKLTFFMPDYVNRIMAIVDPVSGSSPVFDAGDTWRERR